ncbi:hypothetical protein AK88_02607 [Plasmodium fragile]|uniref:MHD domain-containing protein n=1 Tax=Plasmodium fragile TaxID=5857 RepID=A0A0D9QLQ5_PLAFR|nr:uncharacterized protein AK88_02607 [Plasmodium fragile]KJP87712.1 hypothetical protein AK88_02607 [Plasmodium fragile]
MDAFYIYSDSGKKLVEQVFVNDVNVDLTHKEIKGVILGTTVVDSSNCAVISCSDDESIIRRAFDGKFIFVIKKDTVFFIILKKDEDNPVMTIEVIHEIMELFKKYFKIEKLCPNIITNNYSVVMFLINEILAQGGKPNVLVDEILKQMVDSDSGLLNETLKYTPVANNISNLLSLKNTITGATVSNGAIINHTYSNGTAIHCRDNRNVFWRANNVCNLHNHMCVEIRENVNCVLTKKNRIVYFAIQGNVHVHCSVNGSPLVRMSFNRKIKLRSTHLHYTANYNMMVKKTLLNQNKEKNAFYFVPLNERYIVMQYLYYFPLRHKSRRVQSRSALSAVSTAPELTNVLFLTNAHSTKSAPATMDNHMEERNREVEQENGEVAQEDDKREDEREYETLELSTPEILFKNYVEEHCRPLEERPTEERATEERAVEQRAVEQSAVEQRAVEQRAVEQRAVEQRAVEQSAVEQRAVEQRAVEDRPIREEPAQTSNNNVVRFEPTANTVHMVENQNRNGLPNRQQRRSRVMRHTLPCVRHNEQQLLPIKVKGVVSYIPNEYKYKIKVQLILNDIKRGNGRDMKINGYENISVKIPVYNFIRYLNVVCTVGNIGYTEDMNSIMWCIDRVENSEIDLSAEVTLFIKPNPDGAYRSHMYYYEKFIRYNNNERINGLPDTSKKNGIGNCCYHGHTARDCNILRSTNNACSVVNPVRIFPTRSSKWSNIQACAYPDFSFPVYVSFTVIGVTASGKRIERVEVKRPKNTSVRTVYRYCTTYSHVEFRI